MSAACALVLVAVAGSVTVAAGDPVEAQDGTGEVRIVARRLADERVEFGLQARSSGGSWGERLLPSRRFFPASASVGRWLVSSPLEVASGEVRIVARRLADERVEFGLQARSSGGSWGERLLPSRRFFPTSASVGRWLVSSPLRPTAAPAQCPTGTTEETWVGADFWRTADLARVRLELRCGADPNARNTYFDPPVGCVDNCGDPDNYSVLHSAAAYNADPAVIQALLDAGADVGATGTFFVGWTPLHTAAASNENPAVIQVLLDAGAGIQDGSILGTPLHVAARYGNRVMVRALLDAGADIEAPTGHSGGTPLHSAADRRSGDELGDDPAVAQALLEAGANTEARDLNGWTPLHYAAANAKPAVARALLAAGANPGATDGDGVTPLDLARHGGDAATIRVLEEAAGS